MQRQIKNLSNLRSPERCIIYNLKEKYTPTVNTNFVYKVFNFTDSKNHNIPGVDSHSCDKPSERRLSNQRKSCDKRIDELKAFSKEDGENPPSESSEVLMRKFFSAFSIIKLPEITLTDDGFYYLRIVKNKNKLVICFLEDNQVHYLIESSHGYSENISAFDFFKEQHAEFINGLVKND